MSFAMATPKKSVGGRPRVPDPKRSLASLKGGTKYAAWLERLGKFAHLPTTLLIEHALREYAERHGFPDKQPER